MEFEWQVELDSIDIVPEGLRHLYAKGKDGKFRMPAELAEKLGEQGSLNAALKKEMEAKKTAEGRLKQYKDLGEPGDIVQRMKDLEKAGGEGSKAIERLRKDLTEGFEKEKGALTEQLNRMRGTVDEHLITSAAAQALSEEKGSSKLLLPHIQRQVKVFEVDGKFEARVVDQNGEPRMNGKGGFLGVKDLVVEMKKDKDFSAAFAASGNSGTGTKPGTGSTPGNTQNLNPTQKLTAGLEQLGGADWGASG